MPPKSKNALSMFFSFGDRVTKGDVRKKASFDYYMLWVMFTAFFSIAISSFMNFIKTIAIDFWPGMRNLGWCAVMCAILWFQYWALKQAWTTRNNMKNLPNLKSGHKIREVKDDSIGDMMSEFKEKKK